MRWRLRTGRRAGFATGLLCLVVASAFVFGSSSPGSPETATAAVASASGGGDPLTVQGVLGWLPGPTKWIEYLGGTMHDSGMVEQGWTDGNVAVSETLTWQVSAVPSVKGLTSAGVVNGLPAYFADGALYFRSPSGTWAQLAGLAFPSNEIGGDYKYVPVATEVAIARAVRFGSREIALPIRIRDAAVRPALVTFTTQGTGTDDWSLQLRYTERSIDVTIDVRPGKPVPESAGGELSAYVASHTFREASETSNGLGINISMASPQGSAPGDASAYLSRITSLGLNRGDWTTRPIVG